MKQVRLLSVSFPKQGYGSVDANIEQMVRHLEKTAPFKPDFVCFTEVARELGCSPDSDAWRGEPIPGPATRAIGEVAAQIGTHVVVGMQELIADQTFNAAVLIGRDGNVMGRYHKVQPTVSEMANGTLPGTEADSYSTDCGRVGMCICFDLKFPEVGMQLAQSGARIVFFPSMFNGGARHAAWARDHGVFLVVSQAAESSITDPCGRRIAWQGYQEPLVEQGKVLPFAVADVNVDSKAYHLDFNQDKLGDITQKYGPGIRIHIMRPEATFVLESLMEDVSIEDIDTEFELEDLWTYYDRSRAMRANALPKPVSTVS